VVMKRIYLDNAATTSVNKKVEKTMRDFQRKFFGNPGSIHKEGVLVKGFLEEARKKIAGILSTQSDKILFTSGATESNNLAITGLIKKYKKLFKDGTNPHVVTTKIEHKSILEVLEDLEEGGVEVTYVSPKENGIVNTKDITDAIKKNTVLVSVMYANNEIGTIQPIKEIARAVKKIKGQKIYPVVHTDAAQAPGALNLNMESLGVDMASFSSQKFYGPKGSGFLFIKNKELISPIILGGDQEFGLRAGTENVSGIIGMSEALGLSQNKAERGVEQLKEIRDYFFDEIDKIEGVTVNGSREERLPGNVNVSFKNILGEQMVIELDARGVECSTGSACTTESSGPSHVITTLTVDKSNKNRAEGSVRFSLGHDIRKKHVDYVVKSIRDIMKKQNLIN